MITLRFVFAALLIFSSAFSTTPKVMTGIDVLLEMQDLKLLKGKKIGLITNQTGINCRAASSIDLLKEHGDKNGYQLAALFAPEHGINGSALANENLEDAKSKYGIPIFSLYGTMRRPSKDMLKRIDVLVYDIQDIGSRSYTYISTLFYAMEEAAKYNVPVIVLDRPNPINGVVVDGPMLEKEWRSFVGYVNVPYCHGMTIGELAKFFNAEYKVGCKLTVIPMKGWKREMTFAETELPWVPTSPYIPEDTSVFYYPMTGLMGEFDLISNGIGYTLPFKIVGAPWIDAERFANALNAQKFPGVFFIPFHYRPFYGKFSHQNCQGVKIIVTNPLAFKPVSTQYLILGILKSLYPERFAVAMKGASASKKEMFCKVNGTEQVYHLLNEPGPIVWKLCEVHQKERTNFLSIRSKYLISDYR